MPTKKRQPIADKVLKRIEKEIKNNVVDISAVRAGRKQAQDIQDEAIAQLDLVNLPESFAVYTCV